MSHGRLSARDWAGLDAAGSLRSEDHERGARPPGLRPRGRAPHRQVRWRMIRASIATGGAGVMRRASVTASLLLLTACVGAPRPQATPGAATGPVDSQRPLPSPLPDVVARVNGQPIPLLRVALAARADQARAADRSQPDPLALRLAAQKLIARELLFQEALARGVQADARVVERAYDAERGRHLDETEWHMYLEKQGFTADAFRAELRVRATLEALQRQVVADVDPGAFSDEEARAFYAAHPELSPVQPGQPFEQVAETVRSAMAQMRAREKLDELLKRLEAQARIEVYL